MHPACEKSAFAFSPEADKVTAAAAAAAAAGSRQQLLSCELIICAGCRDARTRQSYLE